MKKFWIFILGIIAAIVGFFLLTDKTPTADTPPINNEQQQPGDNTGDVTPDNPSDVGGEVTYAEVGFGTQFASVYFYDAVNNSVDSNKLIVGENYTLEVAAFEGYVVQDWYIDFCDGNMYQSNITFFTATEQMYIAVNAYEYVASVTATMTANFPQDVLMFTVSGNGGSTEYSMLPSGTCELIPGSWVQFSMNPNAYDYVIDSIIVDGNYILMGGSAGQDFSNVQFYVPGTDFTIEATCSHAPATYSIVYDGTACTSIDITDTTGEFIPATYQSGYEYGLKFQAPEGIYVTEIYLNGELIKVYEAGGIASGIAVFNSNATEWNFRIVTIGGPATINVNYDPNILSYKILDTAGNEVTEFVAGNPYQIKWQMNTMDIISQIIVNGVATPYGGTDVHYFTATATTTIEFVLA